jgi:hypothetical protein
MIISSFFSSNLRRTLNWVTATNLGNQTDSTITLALQTNRSCTFTIVSVTPNDINVSISNGILTVSNNPKNNVSYSITVLASSGLISVSRTFTFIAYNNPPTWVTPNNVVFPPVTPISYQLQVSDSDTAAIAYRITGGVFHNNVQMSISGLITGTNTFDNLDRIVSIEATDGVTYLSRTFTFYMSPYQVTLSFPTATTVPTSSATGMGPININDSWLNGSTSGWIGGRKSDLIVRYLGNRSYPGPQGYLNEGLGNGSEPTVTVNLTNSNINTLSVEFNGIIAGPWGRKGENHKYAGDYYFPGNDFSGTSGGTGLAIYCRGNYVFTGGVFGGAAGGGAGGGGLNSGTYPGGGNGGSGGPAIVIYSQGVNIINNSQFGIGGGGGGGGGGWGSSIDGASDGVSGGNGNPYYGDSGSGGGGTGTGATVGGAGGSYGNPGSNGGLHSSGQYSRGGAAGPAIMSPYGYPYTITGTGAVFGTVA